MMRVMISMMCCLIVFGCQNGFKITKSVPTQSPFGNDLTQEAGVSIVEDGSGWLPMGAYLVLLIAVCWLTWREFRGSTRKSDRS